MDTKLKIYGIPLLMVIIFLASCSPVKYVPEGEYLLNKINVQVDNKDVSHEELASYIRQKENLRILGMFRFHLWLYNLSSKKKQDDWLKRIGEQPNIYNEILTLRSNDQLEQFFNNKGYFDAKVETETKLNQKRKKANVKYKIKVGKPYRIRNIRYDVEDANLRTIFLSDTTGRLVASGDIFDFDILDAERNRIVSLFKNNGYYFFNKDFIRYLVDSSLYSHQVDVDLRIHTPQNLPETERQKAYSTYLINNFEVEVVPSKTGFRGLDKKDLVNIDTSFNNNYTFYLDKQYRYNPELFFRLNKLQSGDLYQEKNVRQTFNGLNRLQQFRFINIQFNELNDYEDNLLDCKMQLAPLTKQSMSFDLEGTNTSGNFGIAGNLNYQHRNLFHGAEILRVNLKGAVERQQAVVSNVSNDFNTLELGFESNLEIPKLLGPGNAIRYFSNYLPHTIFSLGYNFQRRPDYTRTISNFKFGYDWKASKFVRFNWNLVDFNMVDLYEFDPEFINSIEDLYIKSSFTDHLILATNISMTHNTQEIGKRSNYSFLRLAFESAGNFLHLASKVSGQDKVEYIDNEGLGNYSYYEVLNKRFAQYVKADFEYRYGHMIDKYNAIVGRAFVGIGVPYGNFDVLPFEKKYFTGGANGIRAWQVRSLGPGSYRASPDAYPNQSSDIKLEANIEYRFKLMKILEGALFFDAGNIWAINTKDNREGATFQIDKFYKQIALGTGTGLRFDFNYFIFRLDLGMKLHDPSQEIGNGWIIGNRKLNNDDFNLSFAIGYPF